MILSHAMLYKCCLPTGYETLCSVAGGLRFFRGPTFIEGWKVRTYNVIHTYSTSAAIRAVRKGARPFFSELGGPCPKGAGGPQGHGESARQAKGAELFIKAVHGQGHAQGP